MVRREEEQMVLRVAAHQERARWRAGFEVERPRRLGASQAVGLAPTQRLRQSGQIGYRESRIERGIRNLESTRLGRLSGGRAGTRTERNCLSPKGEFVSAARSPARPP